MSEKLFVKENFVLLHVLAGLYSWNRIIRNKTTRLTHFAIIDYSLSFVCEFL